MLSVTGMTTGQILSKLEDAYGSCAFAEKALHFTDAEKETLLRVIMQEKRLPDFTGVEKVSYMDGCKVYFTGGGFVCCRFSGTEPVLRLMAEGGTAAESQGFIGTFMQFIRQVI
jgi:phosphomannomutase